MKTCVISNCSSGAAPRCAEIIDQFASRDDVPVVSVSSVDEIRAAARRAAKDDCQRVIVAGGDGTVSLVAGVLVRECPEVELAVLPLGTGNDFARALGLDVDAVELAWAQAVSGRAVPLDVAQCDVDGHENFINVANCGLAGLISHEVASDDKVSWGALAYWMKAIGRLVDVEAKDEFDIKLQLDDGAIEMRVYGLAIANGRYVGGGFPAAPWAVLNDGLLDVVVIPVLPTLDLLGTGFDFWLGNQEFDDRVKLYRSRHVCVRSNGDLPLSIDGETTTTRDATIEIVPAALKFVVGIDDGSGTVL